MVRFVVVACALVVAWPSFAHAQAPSGAVALLPLDSDQRLELYGQPVASEIARALVAGGIDVVVVGPKMAVPARARLVVDGTITGKGNAVTLSIRVRNPRDGTVVDTLSATVPALTNIDRAAEDLSARVLPSVKEHLAALDHPTHSTTEPVHDDKPRNVAAPLSPPKLAVTVVAFANGAPLQPAFEAALDGWIHDHHHERVTAGDHADLAVAFEITGFVNEPGPVPTARARVRVRVTEDSKIAFDRVVVTDTVVGDRGMTDAALATRTVREVLAIAQPHLRRALAKWQ